MLNDDDSVWAFNSVEVQVTKISLGKIDQSKILSILNGGHYAHSQEVVWEWCKR